MIDPKLNMPLVIVGVDQPAGRLIAEAAFKNGWKVCNFSFGEIDKWLTFGKKEIRIWNDLKSFTNLLKRDRYLVVETRQGKVFQATENFAIKADNPLVFAAPVEDTVAYMIAKGVEMGEMPLLADIDRGISDLREAHVFVEKVLPEVAKLFKEGSTGFYNLSLDREA